MSNCFYLLNPSLRTVQDRRKSTTISSSNSLPETLENKFEHQRHGIFYCNNLRVPISINKAISEPYTISRKSHLAKQRTSFISSSIEESIMVTETCPKCRGVCPSLWNSQSRLIRSHPASSAVKCVCHSSSDLLATRILTTPHLTSSRKSKFKVYRIPESGWRALLIAFICILVISVKSTMSNPVPSPDQEPGSSSASGHHRMKRPHDHPAKWINPCRIPSSIPTMPLDMEIEIIAQPDSEIIQNIITQVGKAEFHAKGFMKNYYQETFGEELETRDKFTEVHYDFLKDINDRVRKRLGDHLTHDELEELQVSDTLRSMYSGLQMFAVGLEQIVLDQSVYGGNFHKDFQEAEYQLKYVLCELQIAMLEKGIQHEDVTREIMRGDYRDIDSDTIRNIRDWTIFRDYVNTLEYIQQSFQHFLHNLERSSQS